MDHAKQSNIEAGKAAGDQFLKFIFGGDSSDTKASEVCAVESISKLFSSLSEPSQAKVLENLTQHHQMKIETGKTSKPNPYRDAECIHESKLDRVFWLIKRLWGVFGAQHDIDLLTKSGKKDIRIIEKLKMLSDEVNSMFIAICNLCFSKCVEDREPPDDLFVGLNAVEAFLEAIRQSITNSTALDMVKVVDFIATISSSDTFDALLKPVELVSLAVGAGSDVNTKNKDSNTPLSRCLEIDPKRREETLTALLNHGADMFQSCKEVDRFKTFPVVVYHATKLITEEAVPLLKLYKSFCHPKEAFFANLLPNGTGWIQNLLRCAVAIRNTQSKAVANVRAFDSSLPYSYTDLKPMVLQSSKEKLKFLTDEGLDIDGTSEWDEPPAIVASICDICNYDPDFSDSKSEFFFSVSCLDVCAAGASANARGYFGRTLLHVETDVHAIGKLCEKYNADVNAMDFYGRTPLMYAVLSIDCNCACPSIVETVILSLKKRPCDCTDDSACRITALIQHGADLNVRDQDGLSVVHLAATSHPKVLKVILNHCTLEDVSTMLDSTGASPLHYAVFANNIKCVKMLLDFGLDIEHRDKCGKTSLDFADMFGFSEVQETLKEILESHEKSKHSGNIFQMKSVMEVEFIDDSDFFESVVSRVLAVTESITEAEYNSILKSPIFGSSNFCETGEVKAEVTSLVERISEQIATVEPEFAFSVKLRGSSKEGTKVGLPDEFDFNLIMQSTNDPSTLHSAGFPSIDYSLCKMKAEKTNESSFQQSFIVAIMKVLSKKEFWSTSKLKARGFRMAKVGPVLELYWNGATFKHFKISVDLVPSFQIEGHPFIPLDFPFPVDFSDCELYTTTDRNGELNTSYSDMEAALMKIFPQSATEGYRLAKAVRSVHILGAVDSYSSLNETHTYNWAAECLRSYHLKNSLMKEFFRASVQGIDVLSLSKKQWVERIYSGLLLTLQESSTMNTVVGDESSSLTGF